MKKYIYSIAILFLASSCGEKIELSKKNDVVERALNNFNSKFEAKFTEAGFSISKEEISYTEGSKFVPIPLTKISESNTSGKVKTAECPECPEYTVILMAVDQGENGQVPNGYQVESMILASSSNMNVLSNNFTGTVHLTSPDVFINLGTYESLKITFVSGGVVSVENPSDGDFWGQYPCKNWKDALNCAGRKFEGFNFEQLSCYIGFMACFSARVADCVFFGCW